MISQENNRWFVVPKERKSAPVRLFCFPYAGGGTSAFREWPEKILPEVEVYLVELPGRGRRIRENLETKINPLVQNLAGAIAPYLDKPFVFFGHSMGALIAFELTRLLRARFNMLPEMLFVSGRGAPHVPDKQEPFHILPDDLFLEKLKELNGTPQEVLENEELMQLMLPILRADFTLCETYFYDPQEPLSCPITVFGGLEDHSVEHSALKEWQKHTQDEFSLHLLAGDHFFIYSSKDQLFFLLNKKLNSLIQSKKLKVE